jgi:meiotically up-regulated gene 157 (Mug157) protein
MNGLERVFGDCGSGLDREYQLLRLTENRLATTRSGKTKRARLDETPFILVSKVNAVWIRDVIILQLYFGHPELVCVFKSNHVCC